MNVEGIAIVANLAGPRLGRSIVDIFIFKGLAVSQRLNTAYMDQFQICNSARLKYDIQSKTRLQLLVFYLAFQLLRLSHLTNSSVQVVLADGVPVVSNSKQTTVIVSERLCERGREEAKAQEKARGKGKGHTPL